MDLSSVDLSSLGLPADALAGLDMSGIDLSTIDASAMAAIAGGDMSALMANMDLGSMLDIDAILASFDPMQYVTPLLQYLDPVFYMDMIPTDYYYVYNALRTVWKGGVTKDEMKNVIGACIDGVYQLALTLLSYPDPLPTYIPMVNAVLTPATLGLVTLNTDPSDLFEFATENAWFAGTGATDASIGALMILLPGMTTTWLYGHEVVQGWGESAEAHQGRVAYANFGMMILGIVQAAIGGVELASSKTVTE